MLWRAPSSFWNEEGVWGLLLNLNILLNYWKFGIYLKYCTPNPTVSKIFTFFEKVNFFISQQTQSKSSSYFHWKNVIFTWMKERRTKMSSIKRTLTNKNLIRKCEIILDVVTNKEASKRFGVSKNAISTWIKNAKKLLAALEEETA